MCALSFSQFPLLSAQCPRRASDWESAQVSRKLLQVPMDTEGRADAAVDAPCFLLLVIPEARVSFRASQRRWTDRELACLAIRPYPCDPVCCPYRGDTHQLVVALGVGWEGEGQHFLRLQRERTGALLLTQLGPWVSVGSLS